MVDTLLPRGENYADVYARFRWTVPPAYNIAVDACDRHAGDRSRVALVFEDDAGSVSELTFAEFRARSNQLARVFAGLGIERGDRVGIVLPQRPETAVAHLAAYKLGAVALPLSTLFGPEALEYRLRDGGAKVVVTDGENLERVLAVARARPDTDLWIDANQSYRPVHLESFLHRIQGMEQVRCLEQPVKSIDWFGMKRARGRSSLPIAADEGCFSSYDVARLARMEACDLVVLKIAKSAGLWGCQRSAFVAEANGLGLLGSGLTEAGIGFAASVHLYSTLDLVLPPELNGPRFLADLLVDGLSFRDNFVTVPDAPGLGIRVKEDLIRSYAVKI